MHYQWRGRVITLSAFRRIRLPLVQGAKKTKHDLRNHTLCHAINQWFLTGGTHTPWGYEALKQGVRTTKFFLGYTP